MIIGEMKIGKKRHDIVVHKKEEGYIYKIGGNTSDICKDIITLDISLQVMTDMHRYEMTLITDWKVLLDPVS